ncbi:MAG: tetratricopeptide repeat protein [Gemmatimonadaceae bacterium]|nr:tetratricopeptide repeat protein [Gemmatimonadaceae bacterium]
MAAPNRVEELRKRYHENPKKFFAPFANELRKTGQVDRAILICQKHLGEQPASMNGFVVYGQCLFELGQLDEARGPFESALALDPENLIALRHLGDIARLGGDTETARSWYTRLLEFDRRNDEVIALLEEVGGRQDVEPASGPSRAPNIISVAPSVRVTASSQAVGLTGDAPPMPPRGSTPIRPMTPAPAQAAAAVSRPPALEDAKTVEVVVPPKPAKRGSLFDVAFDFGEGASAPAPAPPAPAAPAVPPPAAALPPAVVGETTEPLMPRFRPPTPAMPEFVVPTAAAPSVPPADELPPVVEGIELAEFSAEVAPLPDLETTEFEAADVARLDNFESESASAPSVQPLAIEGMEEREFRPPADSGAFRSILEPVEDALPTVEGVDGLIDADLDPMGTSLESLSAPSELIETADSEFFVAGLDELSSTPDLEPNGPGVEAFHTDDAGDEFSLLPEAATDDATADDALPALPAEPDDPGSIAIDETFEIEAPSVGVASMFVEMPPPSLEPIAEPASVTPPVTFVTETMAKFYLEQGLTDRAIDVYRQLVAQSPADEGLRDRLRALETQSRASLEFEVPADAVEIAEPAPTNAMLSAMSFDEVALDTPVAARPPRVTPAAPVSPVAEPTGPNVRDFFAAFARRGLTVAPPVVTIPTAAGSPLSPLDELFGPEVNVEDERAAHRLAAVGATSGPSGGTALDSLFGEGPSAPMPPELPSATPGSPRVSRASEKLRFDQFFSSSSVPSAMSTPTDADTAPIVESSSYVGDLPSAAPEDDDLDQFQGWLRGLTK